MKKFITMFFLCAAVALNAADYKTVYDLSKVKAAKELINLIEKDMLKWVNQDVIVNAVLKTNQTEAARTLDAVKAIDKEWMDGKLDATLVKKMTTNEVAQLLNKIIADSKGLYAEIFVMDYQGCIVGESSKTSDFWQGDEDKFIKTYGAGGAVFADKVKFDESTKTSSIQISLPVFDKKTSTVIGAVTVTVNMEKKELLKNY